MAYLVARGHSAKLVKSEFAKVSSIPRHKADKKVEKSFENKVIIMTIFNPRGPNMSQIINRQLHLIKNSLFLHNIFPDGSILVDNKGCPNFKDLLVRGNPYNIKHDLTDTVSDEYNPCSKKCVLCDNFLGSQSYLISNATGRKYYKGRDNTCSTLKCCIYGILQKCNK